MQATESDEGKSLSSPIKWVGGKSRLRKQIIGLMPPHSCYVELFGGAGWVLFGKTPSPVEVLNDIDSELINFFRVVRLYPEELIREFDLELVSRSEFERLANLDTQTLSEVERAHRFYYIIMAGWGGELNYPRFQTSITDGGGGNRLIGALKTLRERIQPVHHRLRSVIIECLDWRACLDRYDREEAFIYIDPPYPDNGCNYRHNMRSWSDHKELADRLGRTKCKWIYSSYDTPDVRRMFPSNTIIPVCSASGMADKKNGTSRTRNNEILVMNYGETPGSAVIGNSHVQTTMVMDKDESTYETEPLISAK